MEQTMIFLLAFLFQVNTTHPPVLVPLNRIEKTNISHYSNMVEYGNTTRQIIDAHYPAGQPKASCGNRGEPETAGDGFRGHILNGESIVYVWETPKCLSRGVK